MNNILISTVAAVNIFLAPIVPNAIPINDGAKAKQEVKEITVVVKPQDTLGSIAEGKYGNDAYWTTVWNDNSWIKDPSVIEAGWKLKIQAQKPNKTEELKPELAQKLAKPNYITQVISQPQQTAVQAVVSTNGPLNDAQLQFLGNCESGMTASRNSGNGYYGAFQFSVGTWNRMGTGYARADMAPLEVQKDAVQRLVSKSSIFGQFPGCSRKMRSLGLI